MAVIWAKVSTAPEGIIPVLNSRIAAVVARFFIQHKQIPVGIDCDGCRFKSTSDANPHKVVQPSTSLEMCVPGNFL